MNMIGLIDLCDRKEQHHIKEFEKNMNCSFKTVLIKKIAFRWPTTVGF